MNKFPILALLQSTTTIGAINLFVESVPLNAAEVSPVIVENFDLKHGISVKIPKSWRILESQRTEQLNANSGKIAGINQADNEILIAANLDDPKGGNAKATARVSMLVRQTQSQADVEAMSQETLDAWAARESELVASALAKEGSGVQVTPYRMTKERLAGFIAIRTDYQEVGPGGRSNVSIYGVFLGERSVKITLSYNDSMAPAILTTINEIKNSLHIAK